jgi:hypothetical protein
MQLKSPWQPHVSALFRGFGAETGAAAWLEARHV